MIEHNYFVLDHPEYVKDQKICKGVFFRGYFSWYYKNGILGEKTELRLLRRLSCSGCERCGWIYDSLEEDTSNVFIPEIRQGKLYSIRPINESRDWETGIIDDYDLVIFEVN